MICQIQITENIYHKIHQKRLYQKRLKRMMEILDKAQINKEHYFYKIFLYNKLQINKEKNMKI